MTPYAKDSRGPPTVTQWDPPYETPGMVDRQPRYARQAALLARRSAARPASDSRDYAQLGTCCLPKPGWTGRTLFSAAPQWVPPEPFDSQADWEGQLADVPDVTVHIAAAAYHGLPVYFQIIAPWDNPVASTAAKTGRAWLRTFSAAIGASFPGRLPGGWRPLRAVGIFGAVVAMPKAHCAWLSFTSLAFAAWALCNYHFVPRAEYIGLQFLLLGIPLFFRAADLDWIHGRRTLCAAAVAEIAGSPGNAC